MPNLINLNVVYDSSGLLTGLNDIDLICSTSTENKKITSSIYDISADPPLKVPNQIDQNTKILTKIEDCNGSYYLVSDPYGKISDAQESNCEFCKQTPWECNCDGESENIPKVISLSLSDIGATSWDDDIETLLAQHINSLGLDIKGSELYFFELEGDDGAADPSDVVTSVSASLTNDSELSISYTTAKGDLVENKVPLNPLEENGW